jgi:hypothetical protein
MAKIDIAKVTQIIQRSNLEPEVMKELIIAIQEEAKAAEEEADAGEKPPPQKKQFIIVLSDPNGDMPEKDFVGWVVQIPEMASPLTVQERIHRAAYDFNSSRRGRKNPVSTIGEACEAVAQKHFKEADIAIKTKIPVSVIVTDNQIPTDGDGFKVDRRKDAEEE